MATMVNLQKRFHLGQITALAFLTDNLLLVGTGPFIKVYDVLSGVLLATRQVLESARVHGFHPRMLHKYHRLSVN